MKIVDAIRNESKCKWFAKKKNQFEKRNTKT